MNSFRVSLAFLLMWLGAMYNLERLHKPINIASFVYVLAGLLGVAVLCLRPMQKATLAILVATALLALVALKLWLGYPITGASLPLTVTEGLAIVITIVLSHKVAQWVRRFEENAAQMAAIRWQARPRSFDDGQADMYQELRRARQFERPLALVTVEPLPQALEEQSNRLLEEVRQEMLQHFFEVRFATAVEAELKDCDLLANYNGRFVLLVPEADAEEARSLMKRISQRVQEDLGLNVRMGMATFPDEELTLSGLVERAEAGMTARNGEPAWETRSTSNGHGNGNETADARAPGNGRQSVVGRSLRSPK